MKIKAITTITILFIFILVSHVMATGDSKYEQAMQDNIQQLFTAENTDKLDEVANNFTRIGEAEENRWLPFYYASLSYVYKSHRISDLNEKDAVLDQALAKLKLADELNPANSEISALDGFIHMIKIGVDPQVRGQSLSPKIYAAFGKAMQLDPSNPRAVFFMGQMQMGSAEFFGKPISEACKLIVQSAEMFEKQETSDSLAPEWGDFNVERLVEKCESK